MKNHNENLKSFPSLSGAKRKCWEENLRKKNVYTTDRTELKVCAIKKYHKIIILNKVFTWKMKGGNF